MHTHHALLGAIAAFSSAALAQDPDHLAQRAKIAAAISGLPVASTDTPPAASIEAALDLPPGSTSSITTAGNSSQIDVRSNLGVISPRAGDSFLLLSTGVAGSSQPEPGTGFGAFGGAFGNDTASVTLTLVVPQGATTLTFDYLFLSTEYPEFVFAGFNDTFAARLNGQTFASVSVDSASFFPAFTSNAGGTGFDLFTPNPAGVTTSFPGGVPDAGLTDWLSGRVAVTPGNTITLVFGIGDFGDDILDSAVLVDNLKFTSLEVLDGDDDRFRSGNDIGNDPNKLAQGGEPRVGICADGTARLLLRLNLPGPGNVQFQIQGFVSAAESGALGAPAAAPVGAILNVASVATPQGQKAFAVYRAPLDFVRAGVAGDLGARTRNLTIQTTFTPQGGGPAQNADAELIIERPPVVLCHGLWSNPATWNNFAPLVGDARFDFTRADYSNNNAGRFAANRLQIRRASTQARQAKNRRGIAAAQVDWIGHSMGGLLPRSFAANGFFRRPDNFGRGDLHKLVTVNTPHWGSPMANLLVGIRETFFVGDLLIIGMERLGMSVVGGAIDDLSEGSPALGAIGATAVRTHAICGVGGSQAIGVADIGLGVAAALSPPPWSGLFRLLQVISFATTATIYRFNEHDFIVLLPSQEGGLGGANRTVLGGLNSHHTAVTSYAPAANQCIALLNATVAGGSFAAAVPPPNLTPPDPPETSGPTPAPPGQGIDFTTTPTTVAPGATINVAVAPFGGFAPSSVVFLAAMESFAVADQAPFSVALTVPDTAIGSFAVVAIAIDAQNQVASAGPLTFPVAVGASLGGLEIFTDRIYLNAPGQQAAITVLGNFSDGVQRIVSAPGLGTTFLTSQPQVAAVSAGGIVTAGQEGATAIIVQNGGFEVSLGVFVRYEADLSYFGTGCPSSVGVPELAADGVPVLGNTTFALTAANAPVPSFVLFALQAGPALDDGLPLPGAPPCALVFALPQDLIVATAAPGGTASTPLPIPVSPVFAGAQLTAQVFVWDFALTGFAAPIGSSPALQLTIGR